MDEKQVDTEKLYTIPEAAELLHVKKHALRRAVRRGLIPSYSCFNNRKLVKPTEVLAAMAAYASEGQK